MKLTYLAGWQAEKDAIFRAIALAAEEVRRLPVIPVQTRGYRETEARAAAALAVAKRKPRGRMGRLGKGRLLRGQYNWARRYFSDHPDHVACCWNGITGSRMVFMQAARDAGARRLYVERAPFPGRITLDPEGVNGAASLPRERAFYLDWAANSPGAAWRGLGEDLTARVSRRADVGQASGGDLRGDYLFCPLQVPNDSQITVFGGWVRGVPHMIDALAAAARALPTGWHLRLKEHPSARQSLGAALAQAVEASGGAIVVDNQTDTFAQVAASRGVIVLNSSVGLQSFFYDKPVLVLGEAYFRQPGLVQPISSEADLAEVLSKPQDLSFDPAFRAAFMAYLDEVYYLKALKSQAGEVTLDPDAVRARVAGLR